MKGAIFDLDGTLIDSMQKWGQTWVTMLSEAGISCPAHFVQNITPLGTFGTAKYLQSLGLERDVDDIVSDFENRLIRQYTHEIYLKPFVKEYLEHLRSFDIKLCVLTASPQKLVIPCLTRNGILELFDFTCSCADLGMTKTDPRIYHVTADKLGVPISDAVFYDDNFQALEAAHRSGIVTVGVFDSTSAEQQESIKAMVDRYIVSFEEELFELGGCSHD